MASSCSGVRRWGLIDHQDDPSSPFLFFGGQQGVGLGDQFGLEAARHGAQRAHDGDVQATGTDGWVGQVDDVVRGRIQLADGRAHCDGLADAHLAGEHAEQRLSDAEADASYGFLMRRSVQEIFGRDGL
jgi:hypothetical protein